MPTVTMTWDEMYENMGQVREAYYHGKKVRSLTVGIGYCPPTFGVKFEDGSEITGVNAKTFPIVVVLKVGGK